MKTSPAHPNCAEGGRSAGDCIVMTTRPPGAEHESQNAREFIETRTPSTTPVRRPRAGSDSALSHRRIRRSSGGATSAGSGGERSPDRIRQCRSNHPYANSDRPKQRDIAFESGCGRSQANRGGHRQGRRDQMATRSDPIVVLISRYSRCFDMAGLSQNG